MLKISWAVYIKLTWWRLLHITAKWMHNDCASVFPLSIYKLLHYQHLHIHVGFLILCAILFSCLNRLSFCFLTFLVTAAVWIQKKIHPVIHQFPQTNEISYVWLTFYKISSLILHISFLVCTWKNNSTCIFRC